MRRRADAAAYLESIQRLFFPLHVLELRRELGVELARRVRKAESAGEREGKYRDDATADGAWTEL